MAIRGKQIFKDILKLIKIRKEHKCLRCGKILAKGDNAYVGTFYPPGDWNQLGFPYKDYLCHNCYDNPSTYIDSFLES